MELQKLQIEKKDFEDQVNKLQTELNRINLNVIEKKNNEKIVKIGYLKQNIENCKKKIPELEATEEEVKILEQVERERREVLSKLTAKVDESNLDISSLKETLDLKRLKKNSAEAKKNSTKESLEHLKVELEELVLRDPKGNLEKNTLLLSDLTQQISNLTDNKSNRLFILSKSEQQKEKLENKLKELENYYDQGLNSQMDSILPLKQKEKNELIETLNSIKEYKIKTRDKISEIIAEIESLEDSYSEKKAYFKQKKASMNEIESEIEILKTDVARYENLFKILNENTETGTDPDQIPNLKSEVEALKKDVYHKTQNYKSNTVGLRNRIVHSNSINSKYKVEINYLISRIYSNK
jgi:chromosome segregation ATPase